MPATHVLRDMALFVEVAKRKSYTAAAGALGMPISSLSRRIRDFEASVGVRLIERTTRKLSLTSYGEAYLAEATRIVEEAERSFDGIVAEARGATGTLRLSTTAEPWLASALASVIAGFARDNPGVGIRVEPVVAGRPQALEGCDMAVLAGEPREASVIVRKVAEAENGLFASPAYLDAAGRPESPGDLAGHAFVHDGRAGAERRLECDGEAFDVPGGGGLVSACPEVARRLVIAGEGVAVACLPHVAEDLAAGRLERVLPGWSMRPTPVHLATSSRLVPARAKRFADYAARRMQAEILRILADPRG